MRYILQVVIKLIMHTVYYPKIPLVSIYLREIFAQLIATFLCGTKDTEAKLMSITMGIDKLKEGRYKQCDIMIELQSMHQIYIQQNEQIIQCGLKKHKKKNIYSLIPHMKLKHIHRQTSIMLFNKAYITKYLQ